MADSSSPAVVSDAADAAAAAGRRSRSRLPGSGSASGGVRKYRVTHRTAYHYGEPAVSGHTVARVEPRTLGHQIVRRSSLDVTPEPSHWSHHDDGFGNHVTYLAFDEPHDGLVITAVSDVEVERRAMPGASWQVPWEAAVTATAVDRSPDGLLARTCRLDSPMVPRSPDLRAFAAACFTPGRPLGEAAMALTTRIFDQWEFVAGATDVGTPVLQVLEDRRGVCQDFAHLLLGALRSLGLGARYVSGYLETRPPAGQPRLVGADASHAWVGLYVPPAAGGEGAGGDSAAGDVEDPGSWVDLDPTNGLAQPDRHVTIGWGRDYTDVVPVNGVMYGPQADQDLDISVDVAPLGSG